MKEVSIVFVIDDDPSARNGLTCLLQTAGHHVRDFASSNEFLETFNPNESGCIVLDTGSTGLSGEELMEELKAHNIHLPIIIITSTDDTKNRCNALKMKAVGFFRKPVDGCAIIDAIKWAITSDSKDEPARED
jgi:FixJ family two-component response regulator